MHLKIAVNRLIHNFSIHSGLSREDTARLVEYLAAKIRQEEENKSEND